jgi:hypothetical protein
MAYQLFVALAPALASLLLCVCVEGPALARVMRAKWQSVLKHMREDEALLELLAELTVHLSTYGTAVVGFVAHAFAAAHFGGQAPVVLTVLGSAGWFAAMLFMSYGLRRLLKDLRD